MRSNSGLAFLALVFLAGGASSETAINSSHGNNAEVKRESSASRANSTVESRTLSVRIDRPFATVYEFLVNPANWNQWAFGLGKSLRQSNGGWIADSDGGIVEVRFTPRNDFGVVDHTVIRPSGATIYVPMRLIINGNRCELLFTLFR
ncbi:MAG: hypothetical protein JO061_05040, partial [Acidobacteriaceae bacterium]|nr:hypothetical protein [Acidobacteriaceae bacterium]